MIRLPTSEESERNWLADWIELEVLFGAAGSVSKTSLRGLLGDEPEDDLPVVLAASAGDDGAAAAGRAARAASAQGQSTTENAVGQAFAEVYRRAGIVGDRYPFKQAGGVVQRLGPWKDHLVFAFLALLDARRRYKGLADQLNANVPARLFEEIVRVALINYLGGDAHRFGWPQPPDRAAVPANFRRDAESLTRRMSERPGSLRAVGPSANDFALDVAAWRPFGDRVAGHVTVLCQCAIGGDWRDKFLAVRSWESVIDFIAQPINALAFPLALSRARHDRWLWHELGNRGGVPLDRVRIARLADAGGLDAPVVDEIESWVGTALAKLPQES